jgi:prepilin-type processing-associated H-X9-DG protein
MTHPGIANIFTRVLRIETDSGALATAFTIEVGEKQYLVTARHVLPDQEPHKLKALGHTVELVFEGTPVPGIPQNVDIAVFALPEAVTPQFPLPATLTGMTYAHDVYFYGYPYGLSSTAAGAECLPLVKRALMSAMLHDNGAHILYLDGFNNPGFSGGPVTFVPHEVPHLLDDRARTADRPCRPVEGGEEAVARRIHLRAPEARQAAADQLVVALR